MKTVVVGGGPAGLIAAYFRAARGEDVTLVEKNEKLGKKLYITGKGRCNVTNACSADEFLENVATNGKFLTGAIYRFPPEKFMEFLGGKIRLKTERGNRVYPESDKASDVTKCLESYAREAGAKILLSEKVENIVAEDGRIVKVLTDKRELCCDDVVLCAGGASYPSTGSDGNGYSLARRLGHTVTDIRPALCGIELKGDFYKKLQGISLKNVRLTAFSNEKSIFTDFGEMLFTHFGISGPIVLSASSFINKYDLKTVRLSLDLKPALDEETLDARVLRDFAKYNAKSIKNALEDLLLKGLIPVILDAAGISGEKKTSELKAEERKRLVKTIKNFTMYPSSLRDISEAIITSGGVSVKEINPKTMESKLVKGLYFAGEIIDADALTGGFNITIAAATAFAAGNA